MTRGHEAHEDTRRGAQGRAQERPKNKSYVGDTDADEGKHVLGSMCFGEACPSDKKDKEHVCVCPTRRARRWMCVRAERGMECREGLCSVCIYTVPYLHSARSEGGVSRVVEGEEALAASRRRGEQARG